MSPGVGFPKPPHFWERCVTGHRHTRSGFSLCMGVCKSSGVPEAEREKQAGDVPGCFCYSEPENVQSHVGSEHQQFRVPDVGCALAEDTGPESSKLWR